ncbi:simple sugar transport system substrate-binding protein/D-xylose transport system substrate-binding protein [Metabacillus crassostreae]|uniref:sugar ABC transporter substrate-binding protein n=1 Tax=Metabacillus crassostreae TaxID=929098 RepID=UPI001957089E|nr:substrate-binding domain-containing protein [Metabacillus crassostreae]MBM7604871.1 simple sugar transport system substrate-binding protein/D-xylose transport system substrate-binding protein [Metabacillus crassostreae]
MARKIIFALLVLVVTVFASACSNTSTEIVAKQDKVKLTEDEKIPYIGFVLDTLSDERWYKDKALFEEQVKSLGGKVKTLAANGLNDVQYKQAQLLIDEGVDVLVVVPQNAEEASKIVELAHEHNVKVISYDRLITKADVDYYISFDNEKVGALQAQEIVKTVSKGNFAYIGGAETDNNAILFRKGAMSVLQPLIDKGDIKLVYDKYTDDWNPDIAQSNMQDALKSSSNRINAVVAANDGTAGGVISALSSAGLAGKVPVSGQDAELNGVKRIVAGTQTMTVYKSINLIAQQAAEMAVKVAKGEEIETSTTVDNNQISVPSILLEPIPVTKENIEDTIIKDGYLTKEEIYTE